MSLFSGPLRTGFGLWKVPNESAADTVYNALKAGYRLLDGAADYGNEAECGEGLARAIKDGICTRDEVFVVSKLWNTNHAREHVVPACKKGLELWGIDAFDLYLVHFPCSLKYVDPAQRYPPMWWNTSNEADFKPENVDVVEVGMSETWEGMEEIKDAGLAKHIGVSNHSGGLLLDVYKSAKKHKPEALQVEVHPYLPQEPLRQLCKELNIAMTGYSTFGPQSFLELQHAGALKTSSLLEHDVITRIAKKHGKTPGQVLLRSATQRDIAVIPKSNKAERLQENLDNEKFDLEEQELKEILALDINLRFNDPAAIHPKLAIFA